MLAIDKKKLKVMDHALSQLQDLYNNNDNINNNDNMQCDMY